MSKKTQKKKKKRWVLVYWVRRGEHKGCWITCTSHSFFPSSSLLFILWLMNVKGKKKVLNQKKMKRVHNSRLLLLLLLLFNPRDSFVMIKKPYLGPSIILTIISCIYMKTHLLLRPLLTKQVPIKSHFWFPFFFFTLWWQPIILILKWQSGFIEIRPKLSK